MKTEKTKGRKLSKNTFFKSWKDNNLQIESAKQDEWKVESHLDPSLWNFRMPTEREDLKSNVRLFAVKCVLLESSFYM